VRKEFEKQTEGKGVVQLTHMKALETQVYNFKKVEFGDQDSKLYMNPHNTTEDGRTFIQFDLKIPQQDPKNKMKTVYVRILGFAHPELVFLTRAKQVPIFVDGTFFEVPEPWKQSLILMIHSPTHDMYIPIWYVLLPNKLESTYWHAFNQIIAASNWQLDAATMTCDFEKAIINQLKRQFNGTLVGCLFHWKQANRRQLLELKIPQDVVTFLCGGWDDEKQSGLLLLLTIIDPAEILTKGIPYIRSKLRTLGKEAGYEDNFDLYWVYFQKTWMKYYAITDWNIHHLLSDPNSPEIRNRTNNALERFNRELHRYFTSAHPNIFQYIDAIKRVSQQYVDRCQRIQKGSELPPTHADEIRIPPIPADYNDFVAA